VVPFPQISPRTPCMHTHTHTHTYTHTHTQSKISMTWPVSGGGGFRETSGGEGTMDIKHYDKWTGRKTGFEPATLARFRLRLTSCTAPPNTVLHIRHNTVTVVADHRTNLLCFVPLYTENSRLPKEHHPYCDVLGFGPLVLLQG